ncbi:MAG TPA: DUF6167 family protein [Jiangellaceae bacterium]
MKRVFWITAGAVAGVLVARKLAKAARSVTPEGAAERVSGKFGDITNAFRNFADDVRAGMAERDNELRRSLGIADNGQEDGHPASLGGSSELKNDHSRGT